MCIPLQIRVRCKCNCTWSRGVEQQTLSGVRGNDHLSPFSLYFFCEIKVNFVNVGLSWLLALQTTVDPSHRPRSFSAPFPDLCLHFSPLCRPGTIDSPAALLPPSRGWCWLLMACLYHECADCIFCFQRFTFQPHQGDTTWRLQETEEPQHTVSSTQWSCGEDSHLLLTLVLSPIMA